MTAFALGIREGRWGVRGGTGGVEGGSVLGFDGRVFWLGTLCWKLYFFSFATLYYILAATDQTNDWHAMDCVGVISLYCANPKLRRTESSGRLDRGEPR